MFSFGWEGSVCGRMCQLRMTSVADCVIVKGLIEERQVDNLETIASSEFMMA